MLRPTQAPGVLSDRDRRVVELVGTFKQMTTSQIRESLFHGLTSSTPVDRTLKRLVERKYLARLTRLVGGDHGGSGQHIYQLGRQGWKLLDKPGHYWSPRAVNLHTLAVADCYVTLKQAEGDGQFEVIQFITEPECHQAVGHILLMPDAYVEIGNHATNTKTAYWLEVDRGTEHLDVIEEKCQRYEEAFELWRLDFFPAVLFIVPDRLREAAISRIFVRKVLERRSLYQICIVGKLVEFLRCHE